MIPRAMASPSIPPRRSLALFALLAVFTVVLSYVVILAMAIACVYLPWLVVENASNLNFNTLMLFGGGLAVAGVMLWSLVPRRDKFEAPGLLLDPDSHPKLFAEIRDIAAALREPMPREVYLIGEPNAWVADRGGIMGLGSRRIMGLGLPLLGALNVSQFRAILAHEFAHYYGGDTSLGPWLYRTQMAMIRTFQGIGSIGQMRLPVVVAILYTIVFGVLKFYWLLFLRAINFVSRRQEYRADELACIVAGPVSLISGLRGVHASGLAWPAYWKSELAPMLGSGWLPSITRGFSQFLTAPNVAKQIQSGLEKQIREAKTEPYDSHPPLRDRIQAASALTVPSPVQDSRPAWDLMEIDGAELNFLEAVNPEMPKNSLKRLSWENRTEAFLIPMWARTVSEYAGLFQGMTPTNLLLVKISDIAAKMRNPKGMLLTPEQRLPDAVNLVATAFALSLFTNGWRIHSRPGEFYLEKNGEQIQPFRMTLQLADGTMKPEEWTEICRKAGIEGLEFVPALKSETAS